MFTGKMSFKQEMDRRKVLDLCFCLDKRQSENAVVGAKYLSGGAKGGKIAFIRTREVTTKDRHNN